MERSRSVSRVFVLAVMLLLMRYSVPGAMAAGSTGITITCPNDITVATDPGLCSAVVRFPPPTTTGPVSTVTSNPPSGSTFEKGVTTVTCTATSSTGSTGGTNSVARRGQRNATAANTVTCTFTITVEDREKPKITVPSDITKCNDPGLETATVKPGTATATDNCPGVTVKGVRDDGQKLDAPYPGGKTTTITWTATDTSGNQDSKKQKIIVAKVDLDIDSDNNNALGAPDRSEAEDKIEDDAAKPGKLIAVDDGDSNDNGIPNFADFNSAGVFVPVVLELSAPIDLTTAKVKFTYSASDPTGVTKTGTAPDFGYAPAAGHLRIWKKDVAPRNKASVTAKGDFVPSEVSISASELGFTDKKRVVTLFLEGINPSAKIGDQQILVDVTPGGTLAGSCNDAVRVTVMKVDLDVDSDNNNGSGAPARTPIEDAIEDVSAKTGKILCVNDQDRDDDDIPGFADGFDLDGRAGTQDDLSAGVEFTRMVLEIPAPIDLAKTKLKFLYNASDPAGVTVVAGAAGAPPTYTPAAGSLRIWTKNGGTQRDKDSVVGGGDFVPSNVVLTPAQLGFTAATRTITLFVEGIRLGAKQIEVEVTPTGDAAQLNCKDAVRVTAVMVLFSRAPETDAGNRYGYDEMFAQDTNDDHVSVKKNDSTFVKVTVQGLTDASKLTFVSRDASVAKVEVPGATPAAGFLLKILGQNKNKNQTEVDARLGTATGEVCATINVNVYKQIELAGKYYRVFKKGAEKATIPPALDRDTIRDTANKFLKYPVVRVELAAPAKFGVAFDTNGNGRVDFYNNGANPETKAIYDALKADGAHYADMVLLKDAFFDNWYISANVAAGDTKITLPGVTGLVVGETYRIADPKDGNAESFTITTIAGNKITIDTDPAMAGNQGFANDHDLTADAKTSETVKGGDKADVDTVVGLSSNIAADRPALIVGATAEKVGKTLAHEQMHGQGLSDVNNLANVMNYHVGGNPTLLPFRFLPLVPVITGTDNPKPGAAKENQWQIPAR